MIMSISNNVLMAIISVSVFTSNRVTKETQVSLVHSSYLMELMPEVTPQQ